MLSVIIESIFPRTHLQIYLAGCSQLQFETRLTPRPQHHKQMFYPFYYKDPLVRDCIFELKERNSHDVARLFSKIVSQWIVRKIGEVSSRTKLAVRPAEMRDLVIKQRDPASRSVCDESVRDDRLIYLVPVPQHLSKTKQKGFCHTVTLATYIEKKIKQIQPTLKISVFPCIAKIKKTTNLHDSTGKKMRYKMIKDTMRAYVNKEDARRALFFVIDDVYTTGATFKEMRRSLLGCAALSENIFFISIAH
jgi:predicted amidophosphoribosyltransferase